jgi:hypothetical protein
MDKLYVLVIQPDTEVPGSTWITLGPYLHKEDASSEGRSQWSHGRRKWVVCELEEAPRGINADYPISVCEHWS